MVCHCLFNSNKKLTLILDYHNLKKIKKTSMKCTTWERLHLSIYLIFINSIWSLNNSSPIKANMIFNLNSNMNFNVCNHTRTV